MTVDDINKLIRKFVQKPMLISRKLWQRIRLMQ